MTLSRTVAAVVALTALTAGCANTVGPTVTPATLTPSASTPVTPSTSTTPTPEHTEVTEPDAPMASSDGSAENVFGDELFADNVVADLAAKWVGLTFANKDVVTGDTSPTEALCTVDPDPAKTSCSLPFEAAAQKVAIADPTSWTLVTFTDKAAGRRGIGAELLHREQMNVDWEAVTKDGIDQLRVTFTGQVRTAYTEKGTPFILDGERDFELWLIPNTYAEGDPWRINGFRNSAVRWNDPVPAAGE